MNDEITEFPGIKITYKMPLPITGDRQGALFLVNDTQQVHFIKWQSYCCLGCQGRTTIIAANWPATHSIKSAPWHCCPRVLTYYRRICARGPHTATNSSNIRVDGSCQLRMVLVRRG